jgi:hypothetical protein
MRLTFPNGDHAAVNLEHGQVGVGSAAGGGTTVAIPGLSPLHAVFATGRRGSWLTVPQDATVIVNARPVKRIAYLRAGDLVCLAGVQIRLETDQPPPSPANPDAPPRRRASDDGSVLGVAKASLRGLSGAWFGRCLPLASPRVLGRGAGSDARLEGAGLQERHAQVDIEEGVVVLRTLSPSAVVRVNGHAVRAAVLAQGDQLELGDQRFVLEAPGLGASSESGDTPVPVRREASTPTSMPSVNVPIAGAPMSPEAKRDLSGLYLLIAAAAALAAALTAFFVYAPKG